MANKLKYIIIVSLALLWASCSFFTTRSNVGQKVDQLSKLPILSPKLNDEFLPITTFSFINQFKDTISSKDVKGKIYVAEFFFSSCPSICPLVSKQLKRVFQKFKNDADFMILSHTLDPENDTSSKLMDYYNEKLQLKDPSNWYLLTGEQEEIYDLANFSYGAVVYDDETKLKNNIMHSGALLLIDQKGLIRGMYDGKDKAAVDRLIEDVHLLNKEK